MIRFNNCPEWFSGFIEQVPNWLQECASQYQFTIIELSYTFLGDEEIQAMNVRFLKHDYPTDIISFDYTEGDRIKGEMYIGMDVVERNADELRHPVLDELCRVMLHGVLHMIGFDDHSEQDVEEMRRNEDKCLLLRPKILISN